MHLQMVLLALLACLVVQEGVGAGGGSWHGRWHRSLARLAVPPLLLTTTAAAILWMGARAAFTWDNGLALGAATLWLVWLGLSGLPLVAASWRTLQAVRALPAVRVAGQAARRIDHTAPFAARVGFWHSELVISRGLIARLDGPHLTAVLAHEDAHRHYRDTFWFFWLGWLRRSGVWLGGTDRLWEELLALREQRADRRAAARVDALVLAEALLEVAASGPHRQDCTGPLSVPVYGDAPERLCERIEALLNLGAPEAASAGLGQWFWWALVLLPLLTIPFHGLAHTGPCPTF
jgi:Zn-dependent protease with chaperone function